LSLELFVDEHGEIDEEPWQVRFVRMSAVESTLKSLFRCLLITRSSKN
jgi:hypothetical protein